jgi:lipopolysaccharide biosynthesis glycosyltransferase
MLTIHPATTTKIARSASSVDPIVLCAADENYVKPLTVMLHSAASNLRDDRHLYVILFDGGISESSLTGIRESLIDFPVTVDVLRPDLSQVSDLMTSHHITHTAYLRLMAARLLPDSIEKVIYLDSDVLVVDDLTAMWQMDLGDNYCLAATDIACPFIDAREVRTPEFQKSKPYLAAISPVVNWKELGIDGSANYFNSGVMVLNLKKWRSEKIEQKLFDCLRQNSKFVWCWDQYALNVVFAGNWGQLPLRWNQGAHVFEYPNVDYSPVDRESFKAMRDRPAIVHYTTEWKPWDFEPFHPLRETFYKELDETAWGGWRPEDPGFNFRKWWDRKAVGVIRAWLIGWRKVKLALSLV